MIARRRRRSAAVVVVTVVLAGLTLWAPLAHAAASIAPNRADPDTPVTFTISTSLDRAGFNVEVTTTAPAVFDVQACEGPSGWGCSVQPAADGTTVRWERQGSLNPTDGTFRFRALTPSQPSIYGFPTTQTYNDGQTSSSNPQVVVGEPFTAQSPTPEPTSEPSPEAPTDEPSPVAASPTEDDGAQSPPLQPLRPPDDRPDDDPTTLVSPRVEALEPELDDGDGRSDRVGHLFVVAVVVFSVTAIGGALLAAANR